MRFSRIGIFLLVLLAVALVAPLGAAEEAEKTDAIQTKEDAAKARPERRGNLTYRERINMVTREPLRKTVPDGPRTAEDRLSSGVRDARPLVARKRVRPPKPRVSRWDHVLQVARGPITRPPKVKD